MSIRGSTHTKTHCHKNHTGNQLPEKRGNKKTKYLQETRPWKTIPGTGKIEEERMLIEASKTQEALE